MNDTNTILESLDFALADLDAREIERARHAAPGIQWEIIGRAIDRFPVLRPSRALTARERQALHDAGFKYSRWEMQDFRIARGWH